MAKRKEYQKHEGSLVNHVKAIGYAVGTEFWIGLSDMSDHEKAMARRDYQRNLKESRREIWSDIKEAAIDLYKDLFNHPEWLTKTVGSVPISANYALNKAEYPIVFDTDLGKNNPLGVETPALAARINSCPVTFRDGDTYSMFTQAITQTGLVLTAASGRNPTADYNLKLAEYCHNVRSYWAMLTHVFKLWTYVFQTDVTNTAIPRILVRSAGLSDAGFTDFTQNMGVIRDYLKVIFQKLRSYPFFNDIMDSTIWMYGTTFVDADCQKPTYINHVPSLVTIVDSANETNYMPSSMMFRTGVANSWAEIKTDLDAGLAILESLYYQSTIRADIIRVFGVSKTYTLIDKYQKLLDVGCPIVYYLVDQYMQNQIANVRTLGNAFYTGTLAVQTGVGVQINYSNMSVCPEYVFNIDDEDKSELEHFADVFNTYDPPILLACDPKDQADVGKQLSISRLTIDTVASVEDGVLHVRPYSVGSDVVLKMVVFAESTTGPESVRNVSAIDITTTRWNMTPGMPSRRWYIDELRGLTRVGSMQCKPYMSIINIMSIDQGEPDGYVVQQWDFDSYARISKENLASRHACASNSLWVPSNVKSVADYRKGKDTDTAGKKN